MWQALRRLFVPIALALVFPASSSGANDRFLYAMTPCCAFEGMGWQAGPLMAADTITGAHRRLTGIENYSGPRLSPDGQTIAYWTTNGLTVARTDGSSPQIVAAGLYPQAFHPSGTKLLVGGTACPGLCWVNINGSGLTTITTATSSGSVSPDGSLITWQASGQTPKTKDVQNIFVANSDGSSPRQVTFFTGKTDPAYVYGGSEFGPNNVIAFRGALATTEIWTINSDGSNLTHTPIAPGNLWFTWTPDGKFNITKGAGTCGMYVVNPDGTELTRIPVNEPSTCSSPERLVPKGVYRQPSTMVDFSDYLAATFEPVLRFDSSEEWRPLNLDYFFGEGQHLICEAGACDEAPMNSTADLNRHRGSEAYVDIAGHFDIAGDEETYYSPVTECTASGLRDCDTGPRSAIYWRSAGIYGGYQYIDYWFFYRANYFYLATGFHEGDWEGITIAPSPVQGTFDYAAFSQHGTYYSYLRDVLRCEDSPGSGIPDRGTCGTESSHTGFRVAAFVANGDHANYTTPCSEEIVLTSCQQNGPGQTERGYDGNRRWGRAFDPPTTSMSSLLPMPTTGGTNWTDWPGRWGVEDAPASPGNQTISISCASIDNEPGCTTGPRGSARVSSSTASLISPGLTATACSAWAGPGVSATVCNPRELQQSVLTGHVGSQPDLRISVMGEKGVSATGRGIAQYVGHGPLRNSSRLKISGRITDNTMVIAKVRTGKPKNVFIGRFGLSKPKRGVNGRKATLQLPVRIKRQRGAPVLSLGALRAEKISKIP